MSYRVRPLDFRLLAAALLIACSLPPGVEEADNAPSKQALVPAAQEGEEGWVDEALRGLRIQQGTIVFTESIAQDPMGSEEAARRSRAALARGHLRPAVEAGIEALLLDRESPRRHLEAARLLIHARAYEMSAALQARVTELEPGGVDGWLARAELAWRLGHVEEALQHLETGRGIRPEDPRLLAQHARWQSLLRGRGSSTTTTWSAGPQAPVALRAVRVDKESGPAACAETAVAVSEARPDEILVAWNDFRLPGSRLGAAISLDGGVTWADGLVDSPWGRGLQGDPMCCADPKTGRMFVGGVSLTNGLFVLRREPGENVFQPAVRAYDSGFSDKGLMECGPDPVDPDLLRVYVTFSEGLLVSDDLGDSWTAPLQISNQYGLGYQPQVDSLGTLYVAWWNDGTKHRMRRSFDGGATLGGLQLIVERMDVWGVDHSRVPGTFRCPPLGCLAADPVNPGHLYFVYPDTTSIESNGFNLDVYLVRSVDGGLTWTPPAILNGDSSLPADQFFPWIEVDTSGRVHAGYYDTRRIVQHDDDEVGIVDMYYAWSDDAGASWSEMRLTETPLDTSRAMWGQQQYLGDYQGLAAAGGRTTLAYAHTTGGDTDIFAQGVLEGPGASFCRGHACPCGNDDPTAGCGNEGLDGSIQTGATLRGSGSADLNLDDLELTADGMSPGATAVLEASRMTERMPFGDGLDCLGEVLVRYAVRTVPGAGQVSWGPGEISAVGNPLPAESWNFQVTYRDPAGPCSSGWNRTDGLRVLWR